MFQMLQSQNYGLQQLSRLEGSMCTQKPWKERMKDYSKPLQYILSPNFKVNVYVAQIGDVKIFIVVYVDDFILVCNNTNKLLQVKQELF
jgi:hypothetical protein